MVIAVMKLEKWRKEEKQTPQHKWHSIILVCTHLCFAPTKKKCASETEGKKKAKASIERKADGGKKKKNKSITLCLVEMST